MKCDKRTIGAVLAAPFVAKIAPTTSSYTYHGTNYGMGSERLMAAMKLQWEIMLSNPASCVRIDNIGGEK